MWFFARLPDSLPFEERTFWNDEDIRPRWPSTIYISQKNKKTSWCKINSRFIRNEFVFFFFLSLESKHVYINSRLLTARHCTLRGSCVFFSQSWVAHKSSKSHQWSSQIYIFLLTVRCRMGGKMSQTERNISSLMHNWFPSHFFFLSFFFALQKTPEFHSRRPLIQILGGPNIFKPCHKLLLSTSGAIYPPSHSFLDLQNSGRFSNH